jgi:acyl carrier protein
MNNLLSEQNQQAVRDILVEQLNVFPSQLTAGAKIRADLGSDSLDDVEIAMALEDRFQISVPEDAMAPDLTVGDLMRILEELLAARQTGVAPKAEPEQREPILPA